MRDTLILIFTLIGIIACLIMLIVDVIVLIKVNKRIKKFNELFKGEDLK